jgi:protein-L-isoaspartate(D-aspartate) O-methyltransferase
VSDERVLSAVAAVPLERFVPEPDRTRAYENVALPIACEQTSKRPIVESGSPPRLRQCCWI